MNSNFRLHRQISSKTAEPLTTMLEDLRAKGMFPESLSVTLSLTDFDGIIAKATAGTATAAEPLETNQLAAYSEAFTAVIYRDLFTKLALPKNKLPTQLSSRHTGDDRWAKILAM
jgi:hypothetical protein